MRVGQYVRCPVTLDEDEDHRYARCFVLAQIEDLDSIAGEVSVHMHDLQNTGSFFEHALRRRRFGMREVERCAAHPGALARTPDGSGNILTYERERESESSYRYTIQLTGGQVNLYCEEQVALDYTQLDHSPLAQLMHYEFHNPSWYQSRLRVSKNMHLMDNAVYGFRALAGCRTVLMEHQVSTVVRCFETRPIRYMLADEVGLGKTVEACSIIKILEQEKEDLRVLYLIPGTLMEQWANELYYKFRISSEMSSEKRAEAPSQHRILALEEMWESQSLLQEKWDVVVVDETHRLLANPQHYTLAHSLSERVENLLLLSATPMQDRKDEYLQLLRLLHPAQYNAVTLPGFSSMVTKQKSIQSRITLLLRRMDRYEEYREDILERLDALAENLGDPRLSRLVTNIEGDDRTQECDRARQALSYICENFRLEKRVIRNRRESLRDKLAKRSLVELPYDPLSSQDSYNELDTLYSLLDYLNSLRNEGQTDVATIAQLLLGAMFSSPWALLDELNRLGADDFPLRTNLNLWLTQAEQEIRNVHVALDEDPDLIKGRLLTALDFLEQETGVRDNPQCKVVVFTSYPGTLKRFFELLHARGIGASRFCKGMSRRELEDSVYEFQNSDICPVIVCDETGGEGRNFQQAHMVVHLDLPWSAIALEQRIGRLDRLGRNSGLQVQSIVIYSRDTIQEQLFHIWHKGMNIFQHSLSGLEIILGDLESVIQQALEDNLSTGLVNAMDDILDTAEEMRDAVEDEQLYDVGATLYRPLTLAVEHMLKIYQNNDNDLLQDAMLSWARQVGANPTINDKLVEFHEHWFSIRSAQQSLFVPPDWSRYSDSPIVRRNGIIQGTFDRKLAIEREDLLFYAPQDPVFDAVVTNALHCGRGRCCAFLAETEFDFSGFLFVYNLEPDRALLLKQGVPIHILSQFRMYFPMEQCFIALPLNGNEEADWRKIRNLLLGDSPLDMQHLGKRRLGENGQSRLQRFMQHYVPEVWSQLVLTKEKQARALAYKRVEEEADFETARLEMKRILNGYISEYRYLERDESVLEEKIRLYECAFKALKRPKITLDSVCYMKLVKRG